MSKRQVLIGATGIIPILTLVILVLFFTPGPELLEWTSWSNNVEINGNTMRVTGPLLSKGKEYPFASAKLAFDFEVLPGQFFCVSFDTNENVGLQLLVYYERTMFVMSYMTGLGPFCAKVPVIYIEGNDEPYVVFKAHLIIERSTPGLEVTPTFWISDENEDVRDG